MSGFSLFWPTSSRFSSPRVGKIVVSVSVVGGYSARSSAAGRRSAGVGAIRGRGFGMTADGWTAGITTGAEAMACRYLGAVNRLCHGPPSIGSSSNDGARAMKGIARMFNSPPAQSERHNRKFGSFYYLRIARFSIRQQWRWKLIPNFFINIKEISSWLME